MLLINNLGNREKHREVKNFSDSLRDHVALVYWHIFSEIYMITFASNGCLSNYRYCSFIEIKQIKKAQQLVCWPY